MKRTISEECIESHVISNDNLQELIRTTVCICTVWWARTLFFRTLTCSNLAGLSSKVVSQASRVLFFWELIFSSQTALFSCISEARSKTLL